MQMIRSGRKPLVFYAVVFFIAVASALACGHRKEAEPEPKAAASPAPVAVKIDTKEIESALDEGPEGGYEVYAIRVGTSASARKKQFYMGAQDTERIPVAFMFFLIKGGGKIILVDTGFYNRDKIKLWKIEDYREPLEGLKLAGIAPEQVTDVIITHRHWDHIGGLFKLGAPKVYIAENEFKAAGKYFRENDPPIAGNLDMLGRDGKIRFTKTVERLFPGIVVVRQGAHTKYFQFVVIRAKQGVLALASDVGPLYENFLGPHPSGQTANQEESEAALQNILKIAGDVKNIIPGHDPAVFEKYPSVAPGVVRIR
jgi:glyoxylase-like metal-dependent hydrolase (beta-lactamase superfamily II)